MAKIQSLACSFLAALTNLVNDIYLAKSTHRDPQSTKPEPKTTPEAQIHTEDLHFKGNETKDKITSKNSHMLNENLSEWKAGQGGNHKWGFMTKSQTVPSVGGTEKAQ